MLKNGNAKPSFYMTNTKVCYAKKLINEQQSMTVGNMLVSGYKFKLANE